MGSFVFKWRHPASEVYVTGTFDDWSKSETLEKTDDIFMKNVILPNISEKIHYKFVVDGNWITDHTAPQEKDESGNLNNVLTPEKITRITPESKFLVSGVTPESTTVAMARAIPLERNQAANSDHLPGTFPRTAEILSGITPEATTAKMAGMVPLEKDKEAESDTLPGTFPGTADIKSGVTPDPTTSILAAKVLREKDVKGKSTLPGAFPVTPAVVEKGVSDVTMGSPSEIEAALRSKASIMDERPSNSPDSKAIQESGSIIFENIKVEEDSSFAPLDASTHDTIVPSEKLPEISSTSYGIPSLSSATGIESRENLEHPGNGPPFLPSVVSHPIDLSNIIIQSAGPESTTANILSDQFPITSGKTETELETKILPKNSATEARDKAELENTASISVLSAPPVSYTTDLPVDNGFVHDVKAVPDSGVAVPHFESQDTSEDVKKFISEATNLQTSTENEMADKQAAQIQSAKSDNINEAPSRAVSPLTVTTVEGPSTNAVTGNCTTCCTSSPAEEATGSTSPASFEKNEKKKKRLSLFGKLKAKLTHREKD